MITILYNRGVIKYQKGDQSDEDDKNEERHYCNLQRAKMSPVSPYNHRIQAAKVYESPSSSALFENVYDKYTRKRKGGGLDNDDNNNTNTNNKAKKNTAAVLKNKKNIAVVVGKIDRSRRAQQQQQQQQVQQLHHRASKSNALALVTTTTTTKNKKQQQRNLASAMANNKKKFYKKIKLQDELYKIGDDVYVCTPDTVDLTEDVDHLCEICHKPSTDTDDNAKEDDDELLECDYCVRSWHLRCLKLEHVPEETFWSCPMCVASPSGIAAPQNFHERRTGCGEFLANRLRLARIENIWLNLDEANDMDPDVREKAYKFIARSYVLPEYTHTGRQRHHIRREVFLTNTKEEENCAAIYSLAKVLEPAEFRSSGGDDVYMCEYSYDQNFSRFRRRTEWEDSDFSEDEFDVEAKNIRWSEGESSSDDDDEEYDNRKEKKRARGRQLPIKGKQTAAALKKGTKASLEWKETIGFGKSGVLTIDAPGARTALERARKALQLSSVPAKLECRESERDKIMEFTKNAIGAYGSNSGLGNSLYISGVPGTGKTATVREVIRTLRAEALNKQIPKFNHIELNGLRLQTPQHAYSLIAEELTGRRFSPSRAAEWLEKRFKEGKESDGRVLVLVVDELDVLVTQTQSVLYNIFDWPTYKLSKIAVIGIANTMDLPERLLPKIASRLGSGRVTFNPYNTTALTKIIESRLISTGDNKYASIAQNAVQLASMKVAQISGDARRALELCRRGIELAEVRIEREREMGTNFVDRCGPSDISRAQNEMFSATYMKMLKGLSKHERIFLAALLLKTRQVGYKEVYVSDVLEIHEKLCMNHSVEMIPTGFEYQIACRLHSMRLVLADPGYMRRLQKVSLNIPQEQCIYSLKDEMLCADMRWIRNAL